jgi:hypothetical protein
LPDAVGDDDDVAAGAGVLRRLRLVAVGALDAAPAVGRGEVRRHPGGPVGVLPGLGGEYLVRGDAVGHPLVVHQAVEGLLEAASGALFDLVGDALGHAASPG